MVEPQHKRVKLPVEGGKLLGASEELPTSDLQLLHHQLCSKCLCSLQLHHILNTFNRCNQYFSGPEHYQVAQGIEGSLVYASLLTLFFEVALKQQSCGLVCSRISEVVMAGADNESDIISILFEFLAQDNRYVSYSAMRALVSLLLLLRGPLAELLLCRFIDIMLHSNNWLQLGHSFEAVRRVIEWKDVDEHPLEAVEDAGPPAQCKLMKLSLTDIYGSNGVKYRATKILDYNWDALVSRSLLLLEVHSLQREHVFVSFVSLWTALISVKNNLNFGNIKEFYRGLEHLVDPLLNHSTPLVIWEKILDLYNEVLCYGSTLALQEVLAEEPCQLAALLVRAVHSRELLEFVPCGQSAEDVSQTHTDQSRTLLPQGDFRQTQVRTKLQTQEQLGHYSDLQLVEPLHSSGGPSSDMHSDIRTVHPWLPWNDLSNTPAGSHSVSKHALKTQALASLHKKSGTDPSFTPAGSHSQSLICYHHLDVQKAHCHPDKQTAHHSGQPHTAAHSGIHHDDFSSSHMTDPDQQSLTRACNHSDMHVKSSYKGKQLATLNGQYSHSDCRAYQYFEETGSSSHQKDQRANICCSDQIVVCPKATCQLESPNKLNRVNRDLVNNACLEDSVIKCDASGEEHLESSTNRLADQVKKQISDLHIDRDAEIDTKTSVQVAATLIGSVYEGTSQSSFHLLNIPLNSKDGPNVASRMSTLYYLPPPSGASKCPQELTNLSQAIIKNKETPLLRLESVSSPRRGNYPLSAGLSALPSIESVHGCRLQCSQQEVATLRDTQNCSQGMLAKGLSVTEACSSHGSSDAPFEQSINGLQILQNCYGDQEDESDSDEAASVEGCVVSGASSASDSCVAAQYSNSIRTSFNNLSVNNAVCRDKLANVDQSSPGANSTSNQNRGDILKSSAIYSTSIKLSNFSCASTSKEVEPVNSISNLIEFTEEPIMFDGRGLLPSSFAKPGAIQMEKQSNDSLYSHKNENKLAKNDLNGSPSKTYKTKSSGIVKSFSTSSKSILAQSLSIQKNLGASGGNADLSTNFNENHEMSLNSNEDKEMSSDFKDDNETSLNFNEDTEMSSSSEGEAEDCGSVQDSEQHLRVVVFRKAVLMVLKAIAVTVKEARGDGGSNSSSENSSPRSRGDDSETEEMDMEIIGKSLKEVLVKVDEFVKRRECYHPHCLVAEWLVKLFSAQDDWMVEAMVCGLDIYSGLGHSVSGVSAEVAAWLCPHTSFLVFIDTVRYDYSVLLDLLVSNETCFLLYLLRYLKVTKRSWSGLQSVVSVDGANMLLAMETMQQLHDSISKLVAKELFPYDITPVLRLLDQCHQLFSATT